MGNVITREVPRRERQLEVFFEGEGWRPPRIFELLRETPHGFTHIASELRQGKNKYSGKSWARFEDRERKAFSWAGSRLRVYGRKNGHPHDITAGVVGTFVFTRTPSPYDGEDERKFTNTFLLSEKIGDFSEFARREYPMVAYFGASQGIMPYLKAGTPQEMARDMFGNRYRKDVARILGELATEFSQRDSNFWFASPAYALKIGLAAAPLVPMDWVVTMLSNVNVQYDDFNIADARKMFRTAARAQMSRLLSDPRIYAVSDTVKMWRRISRHQPDYRIDALEFKNWRQLHDALSRDSAKVTEPAEEIVYKGKAKRLVGEYDGFRIVAPSSTHDLIDWSNTMGNCISSYGRNAAAGSVLLYAAMRGDEMIANMELDTKGNVRQLLGPHNRHLEPAEADEIKEAINATWPDANVGGGWQ